MTSAPSVPLSWGQKTTVTGVQVSLLFNYLTDGVGVIDNFVYFAFFDYSPTGRVCTPSLLEVFSDAPTLMVPSVTVSTSRMPE